MDTMNLAKAIQIADKGPEVEAQRVWAMKTLAIALQHQLAEKEVDFKELAFQHVVKVLTRHSLTAASAKVLVGKKVDIPSLEKAQEVVEKFIARPKKRLATIARQAEQRVAKEKVRMKATKAKSKAKRTKSKK